MSQDRKDPRCELAIALDGTLKCLRVVGQMGGRTPDRAMLTAVSMLTTLMEAGGEGWQQRLVDAMPSEDMRSLGRTLIYELEGYAMSDADRGRFVLAWLANRDCAVAEVMEMMERCKSGVPTN